MAWLLSARQQAKWGACPAVGRAVLAAVAAKVEVDGEQAGQGLVQVGSAQAYCLPVVPQHLGHGLHEGLVLPQLHSARTPTLGSESEPSLVCPQCFVQHGASAGRVSLAVP